MDDSLLTARERLLLDRIRLGESSYLELKVVQFTGTKLKGPDRKTLADELAAFANADGGVLVLGVDDKSRGIVGIPEDRVPEVVTLVRQVCTDSIEPPLQAAVEPLRLPSSEGGARAVVQVQVRRSLFVHRSPTGYLLRVGDEKRRMSTDYLARLFRLRSQSRLIRFDEQAVNEADIDSLSEDLWQRFRTARTGDARDGLLTKLRMARRDQEGSCVPPSPVCSWRRRIPANGCRTRSFSRSPTVGLTSGRRDEAERISWTPPTSPGRWTCRWTVPAGSWRET